MLGRDFLKSAIAKREQDASLNASQGYPTVGLPEMKEANVRVVLASIWASPCDSHMGVPLKPCYKTPEEACEQGKQQVAYYEKLTSQAPLLLVKTKRSLKTAVEGEYRLGLVLSMEGADPILTPESLHWWVERGVRVVGLSHGKTRYAGGTKQPGHLTELGRQLLHEMDRESVVLDTSHMSEESFFDAIDEFTGSIIATHSNCRALVPTDRHLSDEMIRTIVQRGGVIGVVLFNRFLKANWDEEGGVKESVTLLHVVKQIEHICEVAGDLEHVGIGSDLDGGFGCESIPSELQTVSDLPKLADALEESGFSQQEVNGIFGGNWLRFLNHVLPDN
jgi:membrane dipeptidase